MMLETVVLMAAFAISSYTDLKKREIPVWLFPSTVCIWVIGLYLSGSSINIFNIAGLVCTFIPLFIFCLTDKTGGGDLIMFSCTGFILGAENLILYIIFLFITGIAALIFIKDKRSEIPIAPIAGASYLLYCIAKGALTCMK